VQHDGQDHHGDAHDEGRGAEQKPARKHLNRRDEEDGTDQLDGAEDDGRHVLQTTVLFVEIKYLRTFPNQSLHGIRDATGPGMPDFFLLLLTKTRKIYQMTIKILTDVAV
jgi:hypothetical protein